MAGSFAIIPSEVGVNAPDPALSQQSYKADGSTAPLTEEFQNKNNDEDGYLLADAGALGIGAIFAWLLKWAQSQTTNAIGKLLSAKISGNIKKLFPRPLSPRESLMYDVLYEAQSFSSGVHRLRLEWPNLSPSDAIKLAFEFQYRHNPNHPLARMNPNPYIVTPDDIRNLMDTFGMIPTQINNLASEAASECATGDTGKRSEIFSAILEAKRSKGSPESSSQSRLSRAMTDSQQLFLSDLRRERLSLQLDTIKDVLLELATSIKAARTTDGVIASVKMGQFDVDVGTESLGGTYGRFATADLLEGIAAKIEAGTKLSEKEEQVIERLVSRNPVIKKIIDARTNRTDISIRGTNLAIDMLERAQLGEYPWFMRVLREMYGKREPAKVGIVLQGPDGKETGRYEFDFNGSRTSLFVEGEPHPLQPLSFSEGRVFVVRNGAETIENAVMVTDGRGRSYFITCSEMERYRSLAREVTADPRLLKSEVGRAFLRFYNNLQSVFYMVYGERFVIEEGSPSIKIKRTAERLAREQWSIDMQRGLDEAVALFSDPKRRSPATADGIDPVSARIKAIRREFIDRFKPQLRQRFKKMTIALENAISEGDATARNKAMADIRALVADQLGETKQADKISLDLYEEVSAWRDVDSIKKACERPLPERLRAVIVARGVDDRLFPLLERARSYAEEGSYDRAFMEYDRIVAESGTTVEEKIIAQAEKARLAVERLQFQRAKRAVDWIEWMRSRGREIPKEAQAIVESLPPLNGGQRVIVRPKETATRSEQPSGPIEAETARSEITASAEIDMNPYSVQRPIVKGLSNVYIFTRRFTYEIGGPAIFGAMTFLGAKQLVEAVSGAPETHLEAVAQGYTTIATSVVIEKGLQKTAERWIGLAGVPMGVNSFLGSLGASSFIYKGIEGTVRNMGAGERVSEVTGLVGTGIFYGSWKPALKALLSPETAAKAITEGEKLLTTGGIAYILVDAVPNLTEAIYNYFDDEISVAAREEWYEAMKSYYGERGIFGKAKGIPWYSRIGNSIFNAVDIFVPAAWHKFSGPALDRKAGDWIAACRWKLRNGYSCR